jgi:hypothetical protein
VQSNTRIRERSQHDVVFPISPIPTEIIAELEANHLRELRKLSDLAFVFLNATNGDSSEAEKLFDDLIDLLLEGGLLSTWRYRLVLAAVRAGL